METTHQKGLKKSQRITGKNRQITEGIGGLVPTKIGLVLFTRPEKNKTMNLKAQ